MLDKFTSIMSLAAPKGSEADTYIRKTAALHADAVDVALISAALQLANQNLKQQLFANRASGTALGDRIVLSSERDIRLVMTRERLE